MSFRKNISKTSILSSSSGNSILHTKKVTKVQNEIEQLKQYAAFLKKSIESREAAIGTLGREKEIIYGELKRTQRINRNLQQELIDEREIHSKEKDYLIEEIKKFTKKDEQLKTNTQEKSVDDEQSRRVEMKAKDEVIYNICSKYLKVKSGKIFLQKKLAELQNQKVQLEKTTR